MENTDKERIVRLEMNVENLHEWTDKHDVFHEKLLAKQDAIFEKQTDIKRELESKKNAKWWSLFLIGAAIFAKQIFEVLESLFSN